MASARAAQSFEGLTRENRAAATDFARERISGDATILRSMPARVLVDAVRVSAARPPALSGISTGVNAAFRLGDVTASGEPEHEQRDIASFVFPEAVSGFIQTARRTWDLHPLRGLLRFGPYSSGLVPDPIRSRRSHRHGRETGLYGFKEGTGVPALPTERKDYPPPGLVSAKAFNLDMRARSRIASIELDDWPGWRSRRTLVTPMRRAGGPLASRDPIVGGSPRRVRHCLHLHPAKAGSRVHGSRRRRLDPP